MDAILADELGSGDVVGSVGLWDERHSAGNAGVGALDGDLVEIRFEIQRDGTRASEIGVSLTPDVYLAFVIDRDVVPRRITLRRQSFELDPISV